jgi:Asp-tRNA(Asn)/Glu-tRNA(Gln) amidotransferase B subunit
MSSSLPHAILPLGYEYVIGLEVHAQITTQSKLFSGSGLHQHEKFPFGM